MSARLRESATWLHRSTLVRYGLAMALVALAEYLRTNLPPGWAVPHWGVLFMPAVLLSAWFGGFGPGLVATVGSCVIVLILVMQAKLSFLMIEWVDTLLLVVFGVVGLSVSIIAGTIRESV